MYVCIGSTAINRICVGEISCSESKKPAYYEHFRQIYLPFPVCGFLGTCIAHIYVYTMNCILYYTFEQFEIPNNIQHFKILLYINFILSRLIRLEKIKIKKNLCKH